MIEVSVAILAILLLIFAPAVFFGAPFVPTRRKWAESAIGLAAVKPTDTVVDLGSGTGSVIAIAARRGATVVGYEINPILVVISKLRLSKFGTRAQVIAVNFWKTDLPERTTIVYVFAVERDKSKLINYLRAQAGKVNAGKLKVISFGLPLSGEKSVAAVDGANLYIF